MNDDDIIDQLLLRDTFEIVLTVDLETADNVAREDLVRVLGNAAADAIEEQLNP
jgi:hypothetical protein